MAVYSVSISLLSSYPGGENVPHEHFLSPLAISPEDLVDSVECDRGLWASSRVVFTPVRLRDFVGEAGPSDSMSQHIGAVFVAVANFLDRQSPEVFEGFAERGLEVVLFIDVWLDQDQMELSLPASLLKACGRHGLRIEVMSNDISAAGLLADGAS